MAIAYGGARGGGKSHWLLAQMGADERQAPRTRPTAFANGNRECVGAFVSIERTRALFATACRRLRRGDSGCMQNKNLFQGTFEIW